MGSLASEVSVCNRALTMVGADRITSLRPPPADSKGGEACSQHFDHVRDAVLSAFPWNFAVGYLDFGASDPTGPIYRFEYSFTIPGDVLRVLSLQNFDDEWKVQRGKLLTHNSTQKGRAIFRVTDPAAWSSLYVEALVHRLASVLAWTVTKNRGLASDMFELYMSVIEEATEIDSQEGTADGLQSNQLTDVRGGYETPLYGANVD